MEIYLPEWKRNLYLLVFAQFIFRLSITFVTPFLPFFIKELGVSDLSEVVLWSGLISSVNFLGQTLVSPIWGALADRYGRKSMVMRAMLASGTFTVLMAFSQNVYQLFAFRSIMGLMSGFHSAATALIAANVPEDRIGYSLGLLQTGQMAGTLLGPVMGGFLSYTFGYQSSFIIAGMMKISVAIPLGIYVKEKFFQDGVSERLKKSLFTPLFEGFKVILRNKLALKVMGIIVLSAMAIRAIDPVISLYVEQIYEGPYLELTVSLAFSFVAISNLVFSPVLGRLGDKTSYTRILTICLLATSFLSFMYVFTSVAWHVLLLRFLWGGSIAGILPMLKSLMVRFVPVDNRGTVYGVIGSMSSLGNFAGSLGGGVIVSLFGFKVLFFLIALGFMVSFFGGIYLQIKLKE